MDICRLEDYKRLIASYDACFGSYYPELNFYCDEDIFTIKGISRRYTDISGVDLNMDYFILAIKKEYTIYLPISDSSKYHIKKTNYKLLN